MYTLGDIPRKGAANFSDKEAIVFENVRLTYGLLNDRTNRLADALCRLGYKKGDRLAILSDNSHRYLEVYFAAGKLGLSLIPIDSDLPDKAISFIINDSEAELFLVGDGYEARCRRMKKRLCTVRNWISLDNRFLDFIFYEDLVKESRGVEPEEEVDESEMMTVAYIDGASSFPRGVMLSHRNIMTSALAETVMMNLTADDAGFFVLPVFKTAIWTVLGLLIAGAKVVISRLADPGEILRLTQNERCTHINLSPEIYGRLVRHPQIDDYDLSSLRILSYAGGPFPPDVLKQCVKKFWKGFFRQGYGATETAGFTVTVLTPEDHVLEGPRAKLLVSTGKPSICSEIKLVDQHDRRVKTGEVGEIAVKGKNIMMGYWKDSEHTRRSIRNGWFYTGDLGYQDDEGYLYMVDGKAERVAGQIDCLQLGRKRLQPLASSCLPSC